MTERNENDKKKVNWDSSLYSQYRKDTPEEIISKIIFHLKEKYIGPLEIAIDVGCGTGQSTIVLAPHFKKVHGIDNLGDQIKEAESSRKLDNVEYRVGPSEILPFEDSSAQLITASTCIHWFNLDQFFPEVKRVLCTNGVLAVYQYVRIKPVLNCSSEIDQVEDLYKEFFKELDFYELPQPKLASQKYKTIHFPFEEVIREDDIKCTFKGCLADIVGYLKSFSCFKSCSEDNPDKAERIITNFQKRLYELGKEENISSHDEITLYRNFTLIICRKTV